MHPSGVSIELGLVGFAGLLVGPLLDAPKDPEKHRSPAGLNRSRVQAVVEPQPGDHVGYGAGTEGSSG